MKTIITFRFQLAPVSMDFVNAILSAGGITDVAIFSCEVADGYTLVITGNRYLTADEKTAVKTAILNNLISIEDSE